MTGVALVDFLAGAFPQQLFHVAPPACARLGAGHYERTRSILDALGAGDAPLARTQKGLLFLILLRRQLLDLAAIPRLRIRHRRGSLRAAPSIAPKVRAIL
jgi:hypothetical protein